jgi:two-component system, cell cycle response regulator DivK
MARAVRRALIVMDLTMPGMDGWEATRRLKADSQTKPVPVLVLSGHALRGAEDRARDAGADAFLTKPCLPGDLSAKIAAMLTAGGRIKPSVSGLKANERS